MLESGYVLRLGGVYFGLVFGSNLALVVGPGLWPGFCEWGLKRTGSGGGKV